jgi:hypothetical protein
MGGEIPEDTRRAYSAEGASILSMRSNLALELVFQRKKATPPKTKRMRRAKRKLKKFRMGGG